MDKLSTFNTTFSGTLQKPYVALIDGITMGGVSILVIVQSVCNVSFFHCTYW